MNKSELVEALATRNGLTYKKSEEIVNIVFDSMAAALTAGDRIEIRGFGSFTVRHYKSYNGRNPRTGRPVPVPPKRLRFSGLFSSAEWDRRKSWWRPAEQLRNCLAKCPLMSYPVG